MITSLDYGKIISEFKFLKFYPVGFEKIMEQFKSLKYSGIEDRDILIFAFDKWCRKGNDTFPTFAELKKMTETDMKQYSFQEIFLDPIKNGSEKKHIRVWIEKHCEIYNRPHLASFDLSRVTQKQADEWEHQERVSQSIAMSKYYSYFKQRPDEYKRLVNGGLDVLSIDHQENLNLGE